MVILVVVATACSVLVGETPLDTGPSSPDPTQAPTTTASPRRDCLRFTGTNETLDSGTVASDALHLSGELFLCADDVVVVGDGDLGEVAAAAQLAAALGGPLLFPHPQLAAELGRLNPAFVHLVGAVEVNAPPTAEILRHDIGAAVDLTRDILGVDVAVGLSPDADADTVVLTVEAIVERRRVVIPASSSPEADTPVDVTAVVEALARPTEAETVWLVDARSPVTLLMAAALGRAVGASVVAVDGEDLLAHPEVATALGGRPLETVRRVGGLNDVDPWELELLVKGVQLPGGGFRILPSGQKRRYKAFYGHPDTPSLGVLGEQGPAETLERMRPFIEAYVGDGSQVVPVFEIMASVASAGPTEDGDYSYEWPISTFEAWIEFAEANDMYVVLDLQPGRDDFLTQARQYEELLKLPHVGLALDPEWRLGPNQVHLKQVGRVEAAEVNQVIDWLADLVRDNGLPQKMLIVHQFRFTMIQNRETLMPRPELQLVIQMDGDGTEPQKDETYRALTAGTEDAPWKWGWKNFFDEDEPGPPAPERVMRKDPVPVFVSYQ